MIIFIIETYFNMWFLDDKDKYATSNPRGRIIGGKAYFRDAAVPAPSKKHAKTEDDWARIKHNQKVKEQAQTMSNAGKLVAKAKEAKRIATNTKHAAKIDKDAENIQESMKASIDNTVEALHKGLNVAQQKQQQQVYNTWKPALDTVDAGINLASFMIPGNPYLFAGSITSNALQGIDDIVNGGNGADAALSFGTDGAGFVGGLNVLPTVKIGKLTIPLDKVADAIGYMGNTRDIYNDYKSLTEAVKDYKINPYEGGIGFKPFARNYFK